MNKNELLSAMVKFGDSQQDLAGALGLSRTWLSAKINERRGAVFNQPEISAIKQRYNLTSEQVNAIFFTPHVS